MANLTQDQTYLLTLNDTKAKLIYYGCITVIPVGIALNILSSIVFMRKKFSKMTMGFYNIVISIVNIIFSIFGVLVFFGQSIGKDLSLISDFSCIFLSFAIRVFSQMSSWMNVFVTVDRMVSITYPNKYLLLKNKKKLSVLILIQFILLCILNAPNFFLKVQTYSTKNPITNDTITTKSCTSTELMVTVRDVITVLFRGVLPIILMISMNVFLIYKLIKEKSKFKRLNELKKEYQFAFSIFFMNLLYILLLLPFILTTIYLNVLQYSRQSSQTLNTDLIKWQFIYGVAVTVVSYEFFFTFFVNILFNKMFKQELIIFMKQLFCLPSSTNETISRAYRKEFDSPL